MPKKLVQAKNTKAAEAEKSNSSTKKRNQKKNEVSESEEEEEDIQVSSKPQRRNTRSSQGGKSQSNSKKPNKKKIESPSSDDADDNDFSEEEPPKRNGKTQAAKKGQEAQSNGKKGSATKKAAEESDPEEEEEKDFSEEEAAPKRNGRSTRQAKKTPSTSKKGSTKSKSQIESEPESEEDISSEEEKAKKKKGGKGNGKKNGKKKDDSDEDFNLDDESDHQNSDMEEENALKKTLKEDDGSDFEPLEPWEDALDQKAGHKLKRVKKSPNAEKSTTKKGSTAKSTTSKGSTSKKDDSGPIKGAQKGSRKGKIIKGSNVRVFQQDKEDDDGEHNGEFFPSDEHPQFDDSAAFIPSFIQEPNVRDANMKYSNEEGYDPTTLYVPPEEIQKSPPIIKEYWKFKSKHFDKLVALKIWKFYYFYFNDALIVHRIIDMKLSMWSNRTLTFFHESCMTRFAPKLLAAGHKIVIIEQMTEVKGADEDLVRREICQILTRGTAIENQELDYASRFMLAVFEDDLNFGIVLVDSTTHEFYTGEFKDDSHRSNLRTVITRAKPAEIVYMRSYIEQDTINMFKSLSSKPSLSTISFNEPKHFADVFDKLDKYLTPKDTSQPKYPQFLQMIKDSVENDLKDGDKLEGTRLRDFEKKVPFFFMMQAFAICTDFLEDVMLAETVLSMGHFFPFDLAMEKKGSLYLDSQSLMNLEILDVQYLNVFGETHSLFGYMDSTVTAFGKRMLKRWVTAPYLDPTKIKERQEAIEDLMNNPEVIQHYQERVRKFPDLERAITRVYNLSNRQRMSAIYYEDFAKNRLKEFLTFLGELKKVEELVESLAPFVGNLKSKRLIQIMCFKDVDIKAFEERKKVVAKKGKGKKKKGEELEEEKTETTTGDGQSELPQGQFPRIADIISDLEGMVEMKEGLPLPAAGVSKETDEVLAKINEIKTNLHNYLEQMKKKLGSSDIKYVHTKHRYELEVPESAVEGNKRPKDFAVTSKRKGYLRFHSPEIEANIRKLWPIETEFHKVLIPFICAYFRKFYERHTYWQQVINCLGELDCLCSLAILANSMPVKCKPEVLPLTNKPIFDLKGMVHPMAAKSNPNFVPNDVEVEKDVTIFLITGPNMGGKSTLLRQTCLAVIMAQVGSFVPAESFRLSAIDRIFTRVGASDRILEGKSTFFVEMEETYNIMQEATKNSLLIIDELGRGTSTYDGVAIAYATLKFIAEKIGCITLFATHYHLLLEEFKLYKNIETYYMRCEVNEKTDELKFLYRFGRGEAVKSHGIIIAKVAGLPEDTVSRAKEKAAFITTEKKNIGFEKSLMEKFNKIIHEISNIEEAKDQEVDRIFNELQQLH